MGDYEAVIGLEVHCQLKTTSKMFSGATTVFGREPNSQVDTLSLGLPGALPVVNAAAVELAVRAALALGGEVQARSKWDRKHYFYPDLPKGYQISQYDEPFCKGGEVVVEFPDGTEKHIGLIRIHMEEDAGKLVHQAGGPWSEVDLNRAGVPLIEIVSLPDLRSAEEAYLYLTELRRTLKWVGVSDCEMQEGSLRCTTPTSPSRPRGETKFGTRVEVKNLNSFRAVEAAIQYEIGNQSALHKAGRYAEVRQETKAVGIPTRRSRARCAARKRRPITGTSPIRIWHAPDHPCRAREAPSSPPCQSCRARPRGAPDEGARRIERIAARELTAEIEIADYVEAVIARGAKPRLAANWTREEAIRLANERHLPISEAAPIRIMAGLIALVDAGKVARVVAKEESGALFASGQEPESFFAAKGKIQVQDSGQPQGVGRAGHRPGGEGGGRPQRRQDGSARAAGRRHHEALGGQGRAQCGQGRAFKAAGTAERLGSSGSFPSRDVCVS